MAAIGARLDDGFSLVAEELALDETIEGADLVITGEGFLDHESLNGKVVGGVAELAAALDVPVVAVVGDVLDAVDTDFEVVSLVDRFGEAQAMTETVACVEDVVRAVLAARS